MNYQREEDKNEIIEFIRSKNYKRIKSVGEGGLGKAILIKDEIIDEVFVCKKYSPIYEGLIAQYFAYFIDEIKILHKLYHTNIVRIFNYYLYPEAATGYILMEYIDGISIDEFLLTHPDKLEDVFLQVIEGFRYLEEKGILHRDIRPYNILINRNGVVKIIDFGFGKFASLNLEIKSISLNWRYSSPAEFANNIYDNKTEVYFVGKLFEEIILSIGNIEFKYQELLQKMILHDSNLRIGSFFDIYRYTITLESDQIDFDDEEKDIYLNFANALVNTISQLPNPAKYEDDISVIIKKMNSLYLNSMLENQVQNMNKLISIFILGNYRYYPQKGFGVFTLQSFLSMFKSMSSNKQKIILNNLWERFEAIEKIPPQNDLPF